MKTSQTIHLGITLFLAIQSISALPKQERSGCCGLGPGTDLCGCNEVIVKAVGPAKSTLYASPTIINEAAAARIAAAGIGGCDAASAQSRDLKGGLGIQDILSLKSSSRIMPRFKPIGDLCTLTDARALTGVFPAYPGKPKCASCIAAGSNGQGGLGAACADDLAAIQQARSAYSQGFKSFDSAYQNFNGFEDENDGLSLDEQENIYNSNTISVSPADAVSLSLAYGLAQQVANYVPEEKLFFGPRTMPADGIVKTVIPIIHEEKLLALEKPVVELKKTSSKSSCSNFVDELEQEALEQQRLELEAEAFARQESGAMITYSDLGYAPVGPSKNTFVNTPSEDSSVSGFPGDSNVACGPLGPPLPGYRNGNINIHDHLKNYENDITASSAEQDSSYSSDDTDDTDDDNYEESQDGILVRLRSLVHKCHRHDGSCGCQ